MQSNTQQRQNGHLLDDRNDSFGSEQLTSVGRSLALATRLAGPTLGARGENDSLKILVGIHSFFALAQAETEAHSLELIEVLGELHDARSALLERYPKLRSRLMRGIGADGTVLYEACPF